MLFSPEKLAELVNEESRLTAELQGVSVAMNELSETDQWDEAKKDRHMALNIDHARLTRERDSVRAQRESYEGLRPATREAQESPMARWIRGGLDALGSEEREQFGESDDWQSEMVTGRGESFIERRSPRQPMAATASDAASGQEAVEEEIPPRIIDTLDYYGGMRAGVVRTFMTGTGGDFRYMQEDADAQMGEILAAQDTDVSALDIPNITVITFGAKTYSSRPIVLTREMIQDSIFDIQRYVERQAARRIGRISNLAFTLTQTGAGLPEGIVTGSTAGVTAASATAVTWPETVNLIYSLNRAYRMMSGEGGEGGFMPEGGGIVGYMVSDQMERLMRVMVDGDSRPLWLPSIRMGTPATFNGYPVIVNGDMAAPTTGQIPMLFGNFSYYAIRTVRAVEMFRFFDSRTAQKNTVEFLAFARRDARYCGPKDTVRKLTMA